MTTGEGLLWYAGICALSGIVTFVSFGLDKRAARRNRRRIPERTLHVMELCGGWPGALLGQAVFRHKTRKLSYRLVLWGIIVLHGLAVGWALYAL